jgi:hypothetical protein
VVLKTVTAAVPAVATSSAGTVAVINVALTNTVAKGVPFHSTTEPLTKLVPVSVSVKLEPPTVAEVGAREVSVGTGLFVVMVNVCVEDGPPPGGLLNTTTDAVPPEEILEAGTDAVSEVALTNVVVSGLPFHSTTELATKFVPAIVSVNAAPPASAEVGEIDVSVGTGSLIVNGAPVSAVPPPGAGFMAPTVTGPTIAISEAGTVAVREVALTKVVVSAVPFHNTTEALTKFEPVMVMVKPEPPAVAEFGETEVTKGKGFCMVKVFEDEVPPPGAGLNTVTVAVPVATMSAAGTVAVREVALTNVVASAVPFHCTTELLTKFVPVAVSVKPAPPTFAEDGEIKMSAGAGLLLTTCGFPVSDPPLPLKFPSPS